jgi:L-ribulokinase
MWMMNPYTDLIHIADLAPKTWKRQIIWQANIMDRSINNHTYALGLDFGTLSVRALLVQLATGKEISVAIHEYAHGVMDQTFINGQTLPNDYALQNPQDYLDSMRIVIKEVYHNARILPNQIIGIGVDFTACTMLPVSKNGDPLCHEERFKDSPHAYVKLWKHHAAQAQADRINMLARSRNEGFLQRYGGVISSEWMLPKVMQILEEAPEVYDQMYLFVEAGDWIIFQLTGRWRRNSCAAGYKAGYVEKDGYYTADFIHQINPDLNDLPLKLGPVYPSGSFAGVITPDAAQRFYLAEGISVAVASIDAHVAVPACGITGPGSMLMIMGTSTCHLMLSKEEILVPGISGVVKDGIIEGYYGYEAGQACVGDHFQWVTDHITPPEYHQEAIARGTSIHSVLTEKMLKRPLSDHQLIALDWFNGVRSTLVDSSLTGLIVGLTLATRAEDIYRALIEATAFGTRKIIETFETQGIPVNTLVATGGIAEKNAQLMQIYANITGKEIFVGKSSQAVALGSAMFGAVAAGKNRGGFSSIQEASTVIGGIRDQSFAPDQAAQEVYDSLYQKYLLLHDYFGITHKDKFKRLT